VLAKLLGLGVSFLIFKKYCITGLISLKWLFCFLVIMSLRYQKNN